MNFFRRKIVAFAGTLNSAMAEIIPQPVKGFVCSTAQILNDISKNILPEHIAGALEYPAYWLQSDDKDHHIPCARDGNQDPNKIVLYFIHGTGDRTGHFVEFAHKIKNQLPEEINMIRVLHFQGRGEGLSNEQFAKQIVEKALQWGDKKIILAGHSRGGIKSSIAASSYLRHNNLPQESPRNAMPEALAVISIGSPYGGTLLASIPGLSWLSSSVKEMQEGSALLTALSKSINENKIPHYPYAAGKDWVVLNPTSCNPTDSKGGKIDNELREFSSQGHLSILLNRGFQLHFVATLQTIIRRHHKAIDFKANSSFSPHYYSLREKRPNLTSIHEDALPENALLKEADQLLYNLKDEVPRKSLIL